MNKKFTLKISKKIAEKANEMFPKEYWEKYQLKIDEEATNDISVVYSMSSPFQKKDLVELNKRFKSMFSEEKTTNMVFTIYDIIEETPIEPSTTSTNNDMEDKYATKEELGKVEVKMDANHAECITKIDANKADTDAKLEKMDAKIDANHAECIAKIDANHAESVANHAECVSMIDANHTATMAMFAELKKMITDISNSGNDKK